MSAQFPKNVKVFANPVGWHFYCLSVRNLKYINPKKFNYYGKVQKFQTRVQK